MHRQLIYFRSRQDLVLLKKTILLTLHILRSTCKAIASIFHMQSRCTCIHVFEESNSCQRCDSGYRVFRKLVFKFCGWMCCFVQGYRVSIALVLSSCIRYQGHTHLGMAAALPALPLITLLGLIKQQLPLCCTR